MTTLPSRQRPLTISVVTPSYNQASFLRQTLESVLNQSYPNLEYHVIDGGSTDGSVEIIRGYESRLTNWVSRRDRGQSDAINQGLRASTGDILCWINSDDYLCPHALEKVAAFFASHPNVQWLIGACELLNDDNPPHEIVRPPKHITREGLMDWWPNHWFCQQATFWRRSLMHQVGYLDESLHHLMDWELWLRFHAVAQPATTGDVLAGYRYHKSAKCISSPNQLALDEVKVHRKIHAVRDDDPLACFKTESVARLVRMSDVWMQRSSDLRQFTSKELVRECGRRVSAKFRKIVDPSTRRS